MNQLFRTKMTIEEERKSIIPFEHLFMTNDDYKKLLERTRPADEEITVIVTPLENKNLDNIQV